MWGEIESPAHIVSDRYDNSKSASELAKDLQNQARTEIHTPSQQVSGSASAMVEAVAQSNILVKSQQIGEAELTLEERRAELVRQYKAKPLVFLERYQAHLRPEHLAAFSHLSSDPRAQHYCRVIRRQAAKHTERTRVRNQRYAALRVLQQDGHYFSEEQMRLREPLLYEQYIGQYLSDEEILERSQRPSQACATGGLANLLLDSYEERLIQGRLLEEQEKEEGALEEEEEEEDDEDSGIKGGDWEPSPQEKAQLREEFIGQMHQRFLEGKDKDFNYSEVDKNPEYDNLDIVNRDAEEKYFDEDDDDEEEGEEDDTDIQEREGSNKEEGDEMVMTE